MYVIIQSTSLLLIYSFIQQMLTILRICFLFLNLISFEWLVQPMVQTSECTEEYTSRRLEAGEKWRLLFAKPLVLFGLCIRCKYYLLNRMIKTNSQANKKP